jgi:hypothetical protein
MSRLSSAVMLSGSIVELIARSPGRRSWPRPPALTTESALRKRGGRNRPGYERSAETTT